MTPLSPGSYFILTPSFVVTEVSDYNLIEKVDHRASGYYEKSFDVAGWDVLKIGPSASLLSSDPSEAYFAHGYLEGYLTQKMIAQLFYNAGNEFYLDPEQSIDTWTYYEYHRNFLDYLIDLGNSSQRPTASPRERAIHNWLQMFLGLVEGYNAVAPDDETLSWWQLYSIVCQQDMKALDSGFRTQQKSFQPSLEQRSMVGSDKYRALKPVFRDCRDSGLKTSYCARRRSDPNLARHHNMRAQNEAGSSLSPPSPPSGSAALSPNASAGSNFSMPTLSPARKQRQRKQAALLVDHCSFMVKVTDDDVIMAHTTWEEYTYMTRIHKTYYLERTITFSA